MPGGGRLPLVAYGNQNVIFNGNPQTTFFYKVFQRATHFSQESVDIPLEGPGELNYDSPMRLRAKITRNADILSNLSLVFTLPDIYSKIPYPEVDGGGPEGLGAPPAFRWIHMLGAFIIDSAAIFVGGTKVQEFTGEWIAARATLDMPADKYLKWRSLVGDVPELHTPERGVHGLGLINDCSDTTCGYYGPLTDYPYTRGVYPHNVADPDTNPAAPIPSAPSIPSRQIRVPLPFWFSEGAGVGLPLVALQLHEVEVQITLRSIREIYRLMDVQNFLEPTRPGVGLDVNGTVAPTWYDPRGPSYENNLTLQNNYQVLNPPYIYTRYFYIDSGDGGGAAGVTTDQGTYWPSSGQDGFIMNAHLEGTYTYLTDRERQMFAERELNYLVHQVQLFRFPLITTRTKLDLDAHGLVQRIVFFGRRNDAIYYRNDYTNLTNWKDPARAPYYPLSATGSLSTNPNNYPSSGRLINYYAPRHILSSARLLLAGNELYEERPAEFFETHSAFFNTEGGGISGLNPGSLRPDDVMGPLYQIPFALNASDHTQPSGAINMSLIRNIQLEVQPTALDPASPFQYDFTVYVESLNIVKITNGMGGIAFAI
jgi:hypothetical protein